MNLIIYLFFNGNCEEAMNFYKDALHGTVELVQRYGDAPMPTDEADKNKIMHATMKMDKFTMMFSDSGAKQDVTFGTNYALSLDFKDQDSIDKTYAALSEGGTVDMELQDTFWGARFGMCTDKFGVKWMFNWDKPKA